MFGSKFGMGFEVNSLDNALPILQLINSPLQLLVEDKPVSNPNHRIIDLFIPVVVKPSQAMELDFPLPAEC